MPDCFVIMPLTTPPGMVDRYGGDPDHFRHVLDHLFVPAIEAAGFTPKKPIAEGADLIHAEIVRNLEKADLVLCDISGLNPNVFFEFGIRTALDRPICLIRDEHTKLPFDIAGINCHEYASAMAAWELETEIDRLAEHLRVAGGRADNALWSQFGLTQRGRDAIDASPDDGLGAALKLILDEVQQLRRDTERSSKDRARERRLELLVEAVTSLARETGGQVRMFSATRGTVIFSVVPPMSAEVAAAAHDLGRMFGFEVVLG